MLSPKHEANKLFKSLFKSRVSTETKCPSNVLTYLPVSV